MIAILGATGTLGLSLARVFADDPRGLVLFARHPGHLADERFGCRVQIRPLDGFAAAEFDLVINAIGAGDPARVAAIGAEILTITDYWDRRVLDTMAADTSYVFLSSGAIYGSDLAAPVNGDSRLSIPVNDITSVPAYVMAKLLAETRHRHLPGRAILDLRLFAYADAALPRDGHFFICELARSIASGTPFRTSPSDMVRDYAGRLEVGSIIRCWESGGAGNVPLDVYTIAAAHKLDILRMAEQRFGLKIEYHDVSGDIRSTSRPVYASLNHAAAAFGYRPTRRALDVVLDYLDCIVGSAMPE